MFCISYFCIRDVQSVSARTRSGKASHYQQGQPGAGSRSQLRKDRPRAYGQAESQLWPPAEGKGAPGNLNQNSPLSRSLEQSSDGDYIVVGVCVHAHGTCSIEEHVQVWMYTPCT